VKPRALITGARGFVGQHLQHEIENHWETYRLDRGFPYSGEREIPCDVADAEALTEAVRQVAPQTIFHLAALTPISSTDVRDIYRINVLGTVNLLEAVRQFAPLATVLIVTSSAMYGRISFDLAAISEDSPLCPVSAYGVSKAAQHLLGFQYTSQYGLKVVRVCPFNLTGPGLPRGLVASDFAYQLAAIQAGNQPPELVVGDLSAGRDFIDVRDVAFALHLAVLKGIPGEAYNVASGHTVTIREVLSILVAKSRLEVTVIEQPERSTSSNIPMQLCNNAKLVKATGWQPRISLQQSLADTLEYWLSQLAHRRLAGRQA
jgi:GDP-4-dehydro-6-deoxy-D-mannose reductase